MGLKDLFNQAKQKLQETIEKGDSELKKFSATKQMEIISKPVLGGFSIKKVFFEENQVLFIPISAYNENIIQIKTLFRLADDEEIYVITEINNEEYIKEIQTEEKKYTYPCYSVKYRLLSDVFTEETTHIPYKELSSVQYETLNLIKREIDNKAFVAQNKKEICNKLWQYFTECISYQLKDHYVMEAFVKIADDYVEDFSALLLKLFV
ncbi:MAG: hypothetical protein K2N64_02130 [Anaeroplasmataceae bacterium]|nr:hypothetical protein [Anaeroplasmataceae bacterium]